MIVYQASKRQFIHDTFQDDIEFVLSQQYLRSTERRCAVSKAVPLSTKAQRIYCVVQTDPAQCRSVVDEATKTRVPGRCKKHFRRADPQGLIKGKIVVQQHQSLCGGRQFLHQTVSRQEGGEQSRQRIEVITVQACDANSRRDCLEADYSLHALKTLLSNDGEKRVKDTK